MTGHFTIALPVLARGTADRSEELRRPERLAGSWAGAEVLVMDGTGRVAVDGSAERPRLVWAAPATDTPPPGAVLLGSVGDVDHWAVPGTVEDGGTIRSLGPVLDDTEAGLLTTAVAVLNWHARSGFCPVCGRPTTPDPAGWSRVCPVGHQEWPRTDPAVIVLIHDGADRMLLARQPSWPAGRYSVLAGFTEAGESLEATVRREMLEEVGLVVDDISYLGSQPWPMPRSLMIGFAARADPGAPLRLQDGEIEAARWLRRDEIRRLLTAGGWTGDDPAADPADPESSAGPTGDVTALPGEVSIAHRMIQGWADAAP